MNKSYNTLQVTRPKIGAWMYFYAFNAGTHFPHFAWKDSDSNTDSYPSTHLINDGPCDAFSNTSVYHYGVKGIINVGRYVDGVAGSDTVGSSFGTRRYLYNGVAVSGVSHSLKRSGSAISGWSTRTCNENQRIEDYSNFFGLLFSRIYDLISVSIDWEHLKVKCVCSLSYVCTPGNGQYYVPPSKETYETDLIPVCICTGVNEAKIATFIPPIMAISPELKDNPGFFTPESLSSDFIDNLFIPRINNLENLKDLKDLRKMIPPIVKLIKKHNLKTLAEFHLWYKYSFMTTELDIREYIRVIGNLLSSNPSSEVNRWRKGYDDSIRIYGKTYQRRTYYNVYFGTFSRGVLESLGLSVNCTNLWDLLPLSFVADWFINLGDILSQLDAETIISRVPIKNVLQSSKSTFICSLDELTPTACLSQLTYFYYRRYARDTLPISPICFSLKDPSNHILDGGALVIANKRFH